MAKIKKEKKKIQWTNLIPGAFFMLVGAGCGVLIAQYMDSIAEKGTTLGQELMTLAMLFVGMTICIYLHILIHEAGHLVFGLLSGYKFTSFRIGSFMWIKEEGRLKMKRFFLAGTGGQCLMTPPDLKDGKMPFVLYNMGGSLMNLLAAVFCGVVWFLIGEVTILSTFMMIMVLIGIGSAVVNGVPMNLGIVANDGYNAMSLGKNPDAVYAFWFQMKINGQIAKGIRLKDMPDEWFKVPSDESMKNCMVAPQGVFFCNRLMDGQQFEEADALMEHLLSIESGIAGIHRYLMICDRIFCELVGENREDVIEQMWTKELKKFMKSMKNFPSVLRTEYAYQLLHKKKPKKADKIKAQFEKAGLKYPYPSDMQSERELMEYALNRNNS